MPSPLRTHWPAYAALGALFLLSTGAFAQRAYDSFDLLWHAREYVRPPFYLGDANWGAVGVQPEAEATGMKTGDAIQRVNGRPVDGFIVYYGALREARLGGRLQVQVQSPGGGNPVRDLSIDLRPYRSASDPEQGVAEYLSMALRVVALPALCLALGFWVAAVRIHDRSAWLFLTLLIGLPATFGGGAPETLFGRASRFRAPGTSAAQRESVVTQRMQSNNPYQRMPPLGVSVADREGIALIEKWIRQTRKETAP